MSFLGRKSYRTYKYLPSLHATRNLWKLKCCQKIKKLNWNNLKHRQNQKLASKTGAGTGKYGILFQKWLHCKQTDFENSFLAFFQVFSDWKALLLKHHYCVGDDKTPSSLFVFRNCVIVSAALVFPSTVGSRMRWLQWKGLIARVRECEISDIKWYKSLHHRIPTWQWISFQVQGNIHVNMVKGLLKFNFTVPVLPQKRSKKCAAFIPCFLGPWTSFQSQSRGSIALISADHSTSLV